MVAGVYDSSVDLEVGEVLTDGGEVEPGRTVVLAVGGRDGGRRVQEPGGAAGLLGDLGQFDEEQYVDGDGGV